jgi:hypothetical protein
VDEAAADEPAALAVGNRGSNRVVDAEGGQRLAGLGIEDDAERALPSREAAQDAERSRVAGALVM